MNVALLNGKDLCGAPLWRACSYIVSVPNESIDGRVELDLTAFQTLQGNEVPTTTPIAVLSLATSMT